MEQKSNEKEIAKILLQRAPSKLCMQVKGLTAVVLMLHDPDDRQWLKNSVPIPLSKSNTNPPFIQHEFNRDGNSYRSPDDNIYYPPHEEGKPLEGFYRLLQVTGNKLFRVYSDLYYKKGAVCSFFVEDSNNPDVFYTAYLCQNPVDGAFINEEQTIMNGQWQSSNVIAVTRDNQQNTFHYHLTTRVTFKFSLCDKNTTQSQSSAMTGFLAQSAKISRLSVSKDTQEIIACHLQMIGKLVEQTETRIINKIKNLYASKNYKAISQTRCLDGLTEKMHKMQLAEELKMKFSGK